MEDLNKCLEIIDQKIAEVQEELLRVGEFINFKGVLHYNQYHGDLFTEELKQEREDFWEFKRINDKYMKLIDLRSQIKNLQSWEKELNEKAAALVARTPEVLEEVGSFRKR